MNVSAAGSTPADWLKTSGEIAMPNTPRVHLNDNVRTEHLKCPTCRTRIHLVKIEQARDGSETRIFGCPHCLAQRAVHLAASLAVQRAPKRCATPARADVAGGYMRSTRMKQAQIAERMAAVISHDGFMQKMSP